MITLPIPPSANDNWRHFRGRTYLDPKVRQYRQLVRSTLIPPVAGPYRLTLTVWWPNNRRRDLGNLEKVLSDALVEAKVVEDDCLMMEYHARVGGIDRLNPRIEILLLSIAAIQLSCPE